METKEQQIEIMELLERYELALGYLYRVFAEKFPEHADFWRTIENEESSHAFMVRSFRSMVKDGSLVYEPRSFKPEAIRAGLDALEEALFKARKHGITAREAFELAVASENGMLEKNIFEPLESDPPALKRMLSVLFEDTTRHHRLIMEYFRKIPK